MTDLLDALDEVATVVDGCGEFRHVDAVTPRALSATPAWFPDAVDSMTLQTQGGARFATVPYWIVVSAQHTDQQRELYRLVDVAWSLLESDHAEVVARVVEMRQVGTVKVGDDDLWGAQLVVELWV